MRARSCRQSQPAPKESVIPAKAGIDPSADGAGEQWIPAFPTEQVRELKAHGMTVRAGAIGVCLALVAFPAAAAEAPGVIAPPGASSCSGCHAASAAVETPVPRLAGLPAPRIAEAMRAFRAGTRPGTIMPRIARGFSDDEIAALAAWYEATPAP
jgi:sulfide dehydrogenase cytochrome subunit